MGIFDKIKSAKFINESTTMKKDIEELKIILEQTDGKNKETIEQAIRNLEYGQKGEEAIVYELKHSGIPMVVIQDLYLEFGELMAQIDFLIVTKDKNYIIECKNMFGDVVVEETGDFIRKIGRGSKKIYSPITQCERHLQVIKEIRKDSKGNAIIKHYFEKNFENKYIPVVVMANPSGKINIKKAPKDIKNKIIGADQLIRFIKNSNTSKELSSEREMESLAKFFLSFGKENPRNYMETYKKLIKEDIEESVEEPLLMEEKVEISEENKICKRCGSEMVSRVAKRGENAGNKFWGCSSYPKCRYIEAIEDI